MSAIPPKADIDLACWDVRFVPKADIAPVAVAAISGIDSSARRARCCRLLRDADGSTDQLEPESGPGQTGYELVAHWTPDNSQSIVGGAPLGACGVIPNVSKADMPSGQQLPAVTQGAGAGVGLRTVGKFAVELGHH